jgi:putative ABC transport system permease protein
LRPGTSAAAGRAAVSHRSGAASVSTPSGFAGHNIGGRGSFIDLLVAVLRTVAILDVLVCLYALAQVLALTAQERQRAVAVLRALGAGRAQVMVLFAASALMLAVAAAPIGILIERFALGPEVARLAVSYVALPLGAGRDAILPVLAVLCGGAIAAAAWAAHSTLRVPVATGLREE